MKQLKRLTVIWILGLGALTAEGAIPAAERQALIDLYNSTNGAYWTDRSNWRNAPDTDFNAPGTECTWYGVSCYEDHIVNLDLGGNGLQGDKIRGHSPEMKLCSSSSSDFGFGNRYGYWFVNRPPPGGTRASARTKETARHEHPG